MKNRTIYFFIAVIMIFSVVNFKGSKVYASGANLIIGRNAKIPVMEPGEEVRFAIPVENIGSENAKDLVISLDTSDLKEFPFVLDTMSTVKRMSSIHANSDEDIAFYLKVAMDAEAKTYPVKVNIEYDGGSASKTVYIKVAENRKKPMLEIMDVKFEEGNLLSGQSNKVIVDLRNEGETDASDIEVSLGKESGKGIRFDGYEEVKKIKSIKSQHFEAMPLKLYVDEDIESKTHEIELCIKYKDENDHVYEKKKKIHVDVDGEENQELDFQFENLVYPKEGINTSEDFVVAFDLKNLSQRDAKNVKVSIDAGSDLLPKSPSIKNIRSLSSKESTHLEYTLFAKDGIEAKNYPIKINVAYSLKGSGSEKNHEVSQYVGVYVKGDNSKLTPKVIIDNYSFSKEYVKTGESFPLTISFFNTNKNSHVRNVKVNLTSEGDVFAPVGSSSSFFINEIPKNNRAQKIIKLKPKVDADQKTYNITVDMEYEDAKGKQYTAKETIGVPVVQEVRFTTSSVELPSENYVGSPVGVTVNFYNLGRGVLRNMMIRTEKTEGEFEIKDGDVYIGNLEAGKDDYYDISIIPSKEGKLAGKVIFEYEDTVGNRYTTEKEFHLEAMEEEMPPMEEDPRMMEEEMKRQKQEKNKKWMMIGGAIAVGIVGIYIYKKRKKKAEEVSLDE